MSNAMQMPSCSWLWIYARFDGLVGSALVLLLLLPIMRLFCHLRPMTFGIAIDAAVVVCVCVSCAIGF